LVSRPKVRTQIQNFWYKKQELKVIRSESGKEVLHNIYSSSVIIKVITSRRIIWTAHVARAKNEKLIKIVVGKPEGKIIL
jgi:hypothetical protein